MRYKRGRGFPHVVICNGFALLYVFYRRKHREGELLTNRGSHLSPPSLLSIAAISGVVGTPGAAPDSISANAR